MKYFVYITIDLKRRQYYLGCHYGPSEPTDNYYGSSTPIRNIQKSRPESLRRFVIAFYPDRISMMEGERYWGSVFDVANDSRFYNRNTCGHGGFYHLRHQKGPAHPLWGRSMSQETRDKIARANHGKKRTNKQRMIMSESRKGEKHPMFGRKHSLTSIEKNRASNLGKEPPNKGKPMSEAQREAQCKAYIFVSPNGVEHTVKDRAAFCAQHDLPYSSVSNSALAGGKVITRGRAKGWSCRLNQIELL